MGFSRAPQGPDQHLVAPVSMGRVTFYLSGRAETGDGLGWDQFAQSPGGRFFLLTGDSLSIDDEGRPGRYRLIERDAGVRCDGVLVRPIHCQVADDGTFAVAEWLFGADLRCRFLVMTADGRPMIDETFRATALLVAISDDGRFAAIHLGSNRESPGRDGFLTAYDVMQGTRLWTKPLERGRAERVEFDEAGGGLIRVTTKANGTLDFGLTDGASRASQVSSDP